MDDLISRQAVIDAIKNYASMLWEKYHEPFPESTIMEMIQELPSVTLQPKIGHWIFVDEAKEHARCSECGYGDVDLFNGKPHNYCEKCGVKMESEET